MDHGPVHTGPILQDESWCWLLWCLLSGWNLPSRCCFGRGRGRDSGGGRRKDDSNGPQRLGLFLPMGILVLFLRLPLAGCTGYNCHWFCELSLDPRRTSHVTKTALTEEVACASKVSNGDTHSIQSIVTIHWMTYQGKFVHCPYLCFKYLLACFSAHQESRAEMQIDTESPRRDSHPKIAPEVPSVSLKHYLSKRHGKGPTRADVEFLPSPKVSATRLLYSPYPPSSLAAPTSSRQTPRTSHVHSHAHSQKQPPQPQQQQHPNPFKNCNLQSEFFPTLPSGRCVVRQWGAHLALEAPGIHITASGETAGKGWSSLQGDDCAFIGYSEAGTIVLGCNDGVGGLRAVTQGRLDSSKWARCLAEKLLLVHCHSSDPGGATSTTSLKNFYYTAWEAARAEAEYGAATSCIARVTPSPSPDDSPSGIAKCVCTGMASSLQRHGEVVTLGQRHPSSWDPTEPWRSTSPTPWN